MSNRTNFVFNLVFQRLLGIEFELVDETSHAHIIYSNYNNNLSLIFIPHCSNLLTSTGFEPIDVPFKNSGSETILFPSEKPEPGHWEFDLFAAVFYLVSRYEEYQGFIPDAHKRFPPEASILYKTKKF